MIDPKAANPFLPLVLQWLDDPSSSDPFAQFVAFYRAEARYIRERLKDADRRAEDHEELARDLELLIEALRNDPIAYAEAAEFEAVAPGTIRNKVSAGTLCGSNGKVLIADLRIGPELPGLQALMAVDRLAGRQKRSAPHTDAAEGRGEASDPEKRQNRIKARVAEVRERQARVANNR